MIGEPDFGKLTEEFQRISLMHRLALRKRAARIVLGPSVTRVFAKGTKKELLQILDDISIDEIVRVRNQEQFKAWFRAHLDRVARVVKRLNHHNERVTPGYKWGHATKVLILWIREVVLNSRYFDDATVKRVSPWLYAPIDSIVLNRLRTVGCTVPFQAIKDIDSAEKFYGLQELLGQAADRVGIPRVWFDDNWGDRQ